LFELMAGPRARPFLFETPAASLIVRLTVADAAVATTERKTAAQS
jgi:hypothetical protein